MTLGLLIIFVIYDKNINYKLSHMFKILYQCLKKHFNICLRIVSKINVKMCMVDYQEKYLSKVDHGMFS
jgi:hypothetical protein